MKHILIAGAAMLLLCGCTAQSADSSPAAAPAETTIPAETTVPAPAETTIPAPAETLPPQLTAAEITAHGAEIEYGGKGHVNYITGCFSDEPVESMEDAKRVIASLSELLGCTDIYSEIVPDQPSESVGFTVYRFTQYYEGIPTNRILNLHVRAETNQVSELVCGYIPGLHLDPEPAVSAEDALAAAQKTYPDVKFEQPTLYIIAENQDADNAQLIWRVNGASGYEVEVSAAHGSVLYAFDGIYE